MVKLKSLKFVLVIIPNELGLFLEFDIRKIKKQNRRHHEIDLVRTIQEDVRRETRSNSQALARLERTVTNLADIARLHQQSLRQSERQFQEFQRNNVEFWRTTNAALERIDRIFDYLLKQSGGQDKI
ncbi:MAG: hypothetical protein WCO29_07365 [Nostocales cyanobacterium ELA583]|jgi:hypothetical protein